MIAARSAQKQRPIACVLINKVVNVWSELFFFANVANYCVVSRREKDDESSSYCVTTSSNIIEQKKRVFDHFAIRWIFVKRIAAPTVPRCDSIECCCLFLLHSDFVDLWRHFDISVARLICSRYKKKLLVSRLTEHVVLRALKAWRILNDQPKVLSSDLLERLETETT